MARKELSTLNLALTVIRSVLGWDQADLAQAAGVQPKVISDYERGHRPLTREKLEMLAGAMGVPADTVDRALSFVRSVRQMAQAPGYPDAGTDADRRQIEALAMGVGSVVTDSTRSVLSAVTSQGRTLVVREQAQGLWRRLRVRKPSERRLLVKGLDEFRNWGLCELLCAESIKAAADNADRAVELAELALWIADLSP
ncbi:MAG: helix-turn-helix transcriptional regulator, partial [Thermoanaerobaculia bacterium]